MGKKKKEHLSAEEALAQALVPESEWPYQVPGNWVWTKVEYLRENENGFFDGDWILSENMDSQGTVRLIQLSDIGILEFLDKSKKYINENTFHELGCSKILEGDILISRMADPIARSCLMPKMESICITVVDVAVLRCNQLFVNRKYTNYLFNAPWFTDAAMDVARGTTRIRITRSNLGQLPFPLPPLAEQQRIVDRIESLFEKFDQAKGLIQDAFDSFENRKAAILHKAFSGELTKKWRKENGVGMESWDEKRFEEFCFLNRGFDLPSSQRTKGKYDLVTSSGITDSHNDFKVNGPGVVTGRSGTIGKVFYIENDYWPLNTTLYSKKTYGNNVKFIYYYLMTFDFKNYSSSTAVPTLNRNNFSDVLVLVPSLEEQNEIVRVLDRLIDLESSALQLCQLTEAIETMKKSILTRAFRGELGTNDYDEESAIGLLLESILKTKNNEENKIKKIIEPEVSVMTLTIMDALQKHDRLTPEQLKEITKLEIDDFYDELKRLINENAIIESRYNDDIYLEVSK